MCYLQANHLPADPPSRSRLVILNFKKIDPEIDPQKGIEELPPNATGVLSMLAPKFLNVLVNSQGVRDCAEFVSQVTGLHRSRSDANAALVLWATLYFKRMFTVSPLSITFQVPTLLYFANKICSASVQQAHADETRILAKFVRHMSACMDSIDPISAGSMFLGPHNVRTVFNDKDLDSLKSGDYVYIKVDQVVNVLSRQGVKYNAREVISSIKEEGLHRINNISFMRGRWHNIAVYPVSTRRVDVGLQTEHLMAEEDLPLPSVHRQGYGLRHLQEVVRQRGLLRDHAGRPQGHGGRHQQDLPQERRRVRGARARPGVDRLRRHPHAYYWLGPARPGDAALRAPAQVLQDAGRVHRPRLHRLGQRPGLGHAGGIN